MEVRVQFLEDVGGVADGVLGVDDVHLASGHRGFRLHDVDRSGGADADTGARLVEEVLREPAAAAREAG